MSWMNLGPGSVWMLTLTLISTNYIRRISGSYLRRRFWMTMLVLSWRTLFKNGGSSVCMSLFRIVLPWYWPAFFCRSKYDVNVEDNLAFQDESPKSTDPKTYWKRYGPEARSTFSVAELLTELTSQDQQVTSPELIPSPPFDQFFNNPLGLPVGWDQELWTEDTAIFPIQGPFTDDFTTYAMKDGIYIPLSQLPLLLNFCHDSSIRKVSWWGERLNLMQMKGIVDQELS